MISLIFACIVVVLQPVDSLDALRDAVRRAKPGERVVLATGTYSGSVWLEKIKGEKPTLPSVEKDGVVGEDPRLTDPANGDFRPAKDGPGAKVGAHAERGKK